MCAFVLILFKLLKFVCAPACSCPVGGNHGASRGKWGPQGQLQGSLWPLVSTGGPTISFKFGPLIAIVHFHQLFLKILTNFVTRTGMHTEVYILLCLLTNWIFKIQLSPPKTEGTFQETHHYRHIDVDTWLRFFFCLPILCLISLYFLASWKMSGTILTRSDN